MRARSEKSVVNNRINVGLVYVFCGGNDDCSGKYALCKNEFLGTCETGACRRSSGGRQGGDSVDSIGPFHEPYICRTSGSARGQFEMSSDFNETLPADELEAWGL